VRLIWPLFLFACLMFCALSGVAHAQISPLPVIDSELRANFPKVESIKAADLQNLLDEGKRPIILDIREAEEFDVSHLTGARRVDPDANLEEILRVTGPNLKNQSIIMYCSVGVRSTQLADRLHDALKAKGAGRIANLSQGIFGWHNAKRPLIQGTRATPYVHPYDALWGQLVNQQKLTSYAPVFPGKMPVTGPELNEILLRLGVFLGVFVLLALAESLRPRRLRLLSCRTRWFSHFGMLGLATLLVRLAAFGFPLLGATAAAIYAAQHNWGLFHWLNMPGWAEILLAIMLLDLAIWAQHVATHHMPVLWRFHMVHHADRDLDVSSALRFHPIEILLSALYKLAVILIVGPAVIAVIAFEVLLNASAMFNHANWALPDRWDWVLRLLIVTPDMHRIHHSTLRAEHDRNFGFCLSLWDRMFGTYKTTPDAGQDGMVLGLPDWQMDDEPTRLRWLLRMPFIPQKR
jgi:sterol desaturase/sphingolipid hydroxylase (fatty acid hydroxylase superfamily)/rhodanese-related sulfurtransferase